MDENSSITSSGSGSPPSAAPREPPRPATRPPAPPVSPSFENHAFQPDETDCAPRHDPIIGQKGDTQNGESKHLNGSEPNHVLQNGDTKNGTKMGDPNHNGNQLNNESFGINNGKVDTPVDVKEKSAYEAVNLELVNIAPKNGAMNKDNMLPAKKDVRVDISTNAYDEYFVPVNQHRKFMRGEKLYVTADKRKRGGCQRPLTWTLGLVLLVAAILIITLAATGVIFRTPATPVNGTAPADESTSLSPFNLPSHANRTLTNVTETRHSMHDIDAVTDAIMMSPDDGYLENTSTFNAEASPEASSEPEPETSKNVIESSAEPTNTEAMPEPTNEPSPEPTKEPSPQPTNEPSPEPTKEPSPEPTKEPSPEPTNEPSPEPTKEPSPEPAVIASSPEPTSEPSAAVHESSVEPTSEPDQSTNVHSTEPVSEPSSEPIAPQYVPVVVSEPIAEPTTTATPEEAKSEPTSEHVMKEEIVPDSSSEPVSEPSPSATYAESQPEPSPEPGTLEIVPGTSAEPTSEPVSAETTPKGSSEPSAEPAADNSLNIIETNPTTTTEEPKLNSTMNEVSSSMSTASQSDQTDVVREDKQLDHSIISVGPVETTTGISEMVTGTAPPSQSSSDEGLVMNVVSLSPEESSNADQGMIAMTTTASPSPAMETTPAEPFVSSVLVGGSQTINMSDNNALDVENKTNPPSEEEPPKTTTEMATLAAEKTILFPNSPSSLEIEPQPMTSTSESSMNITSNTMTSTSEVPTESPNIGSSETTMENKLGTAPSSEMSNDLNNMTDQEMATHGPIMLTEILHQYEVTEPSEEPFMPQEGVTTVAPRIVTAETSSVVTPVSDYNTNSVTSMSSSGTVIETGRGFNSDNYPQIIMETSTSPEHKGTIPTLPTIQEETTAADNAPMTEMANSVTMKIDATEPEVENAEVSKIEVEATTLMDMLSTMETGNIAMTTTEQGNEIGTMAPEVMGMEAKENDMPELKTTTPPTSTSTESISEAASSGIIISEVNNVSETEVSVYPTSTSEKAIDQQVMESTVQPIVASSNDDTVSVTDNEVSPSNMGSTSAPIVEQKTVSITSTPSTFPEATTLSIEEAIKQFNDVISAEITKSNEQVQPMEETTSEVKTVSPLLDMLTHSSAVEMLPNGMNTVMPFTAEEDLKLLPVETTTGITEISSASSTGADLQLSNEENTTQNLNLADVMIPKSESPMPSTETAALQNERSTTVSNEMLNRELGGPIFDIIAHLTTTLRPTTTSESPIEITPSSTEAKIEESTTETMEQAENDAKETLKENQPTATPILPIQQTEITSEMPVELVSSTEIVSLAEVSSQGLSKDVTILPTERNTVTNKEIKSSQDTDTTTTTETVKEMSSEQVTANEMNTEVPSKSMDTEMEREFNTDVPDSTEMSDGTTDEANTEEVPMFTTAEAIISSSVDISTESQTIAFDGSKDLVANTPEVTFRIANYSCQTATPDPLPLISKLEGLLTKALISDVGEDNEENKVVRVTDLRPGGIVTYSIQWTPKPGTNTIFNTIPQADLTELNDYLRTNNRLLGDFLVPEDARETTKYDFSTCQDDNLTGNDIFEDSLNLFPGSKDEASPLKI